MCGIVGYSGKGDGAPVVIDGLKRLEYRGYDSWGVVTAAKGKLVSHKQVGKIGGFELQRDLPGFSGSLCIGHTRWATHGGVTEVNSHPHFSCDGSIAVVHNGIVENYQELRSELEAKGHAFRSQTDTEVIAHLIEEEVKGKGTYVEAVRRALQQLEGSYAVAVVNQAEKLLIGARKGSPLVLGIGKDAYYLASDVPAFLKFTSTVVFLDEYQMVVLPESPKEPYAVSDVRSGKSVAVEEVKVEWTLDEAEKGGHPHFMVKEMLEQPLVVAKTIATPKDEIEAAAAMIKGAKRLYVVACGTALHAGMYGSYLFAAQNNLSLQPISAGEFPYFAHLIDKDDVVITVSQSGETADVLESVRSAQAKGAKVLALVNVMGSSLMRLADRSLLTKAGPEICVLSTKAYVSQLAMFVLLSAALRGKLEEGKAALAVTQKDIEAILSDKSRKQIEKLGKRLATVPNVYALGRGVNYPNALESCLKIKEVSYIHAEGFAGGDLKHGPIALIEAGVPVLIFASDDGATKEIVSNAMEVKARGAEIIGIAPEPNQVYDTYLPVAANGLYTPLAAIVYSQLMAYAIALTKGLDPDKPRNLAKSVTVK